MLQSIPVRSNRMGWTEQATRPQIIPEVVDWVACNSKHYPTEVNQLQSKIHQLTMEHKRLYTEWHSQRQAYPLQLTVAHIKKGLATLFCLVMAIWIFQIGQSEAPFWWVPGLSLFFGLAAIVIGQELFWRDPHSLKAELRKQIRSTQDGLKQLQHRHAMVTGKNF